MEVITNYSMKVDELDLGHIPVVIAALRALKFLRYKPTVVCYGVRMFGNVNNRQMANCTIYQV